MKKKRIIIFTGCFIVLAILILIITLSRKKNINKNISEEIKTAIAYESEFTSSVDMSGYLEAADTQSVQFRSTGAITGVFVKVGDKVKKGDLLATIDDTNQKYNLIKLEQDIEKAQYTASDREIELLKLQYQNAVNNLEYTRAVAHFDGVVTDVNIATGDYAEAAKTLDLMKIVDMSSLKATVEVDEMDVMALSEGMEVYLNFDSLPGQKVKAVISYIPLLGTYNSSSGIGVKKVELTIHNPPEGIYPGYSFSSTVTSSSKTKYLMIPSSAIKSRRGKSYVTKLGENGENTEIEVGVRYLGEGLSQILSGDIKKGDKVVLSSSKGQNALISAPMPM